MNSLENIEEFFNKKADQSKRTPIKKNANSSLLLSYNPNSYLKLDFNTLDNHNFFDLADTTFMNNISDFSTPNETLEIITTIKPASDEEFEYLKEELKKIADTGFLDSFPYLNQYIKELKKVEVIIDNIRHVNSRDFDDSDMKNERQLSIETSLKNITENRLFIENVTNKFLRLRSNISFWLHNEASFDPDESSSILTKLQQFMKDNDSIFNENIKKDIEKTRNIVVTEIEKVKEQTYKMIAAGKDIDSKYLSYADHYVRKKQDESAVSVFVADKMLDTVISAQLHFSKPEINQSVYLLEDGSIFFKKRNGDYGTITNSEDYTNLMIDISKDLIAEKIKNKPKLINYFYNKLNEDGLYFDNLNNAFNTIDTFLNNEDILKNININLLEIKNKNFEAIDDYLNAEINIYKINKFTNKILSNKYKFLKSDQSSVYFKELYEKSLSEKDLQNYIGKKLAALKTPEDLTALLKNVFNQLDGFNVESVTDKLARFNIEPIINENNIMVFQVSTYKQCQAFGSPSWCIHRDESYFKTYTREDAKQLIIYDFNQESKSNTSLIGFTVKSNGKLSTQHLKNDDYVEFDKKLNNIYLDTVEKLIEKDLLSNEIITELEDRRLNEKTAIKIKKSHP